MSNLEKAKITNIEAKEDEKEISSFLVQFNPSSLKIRITNQIEGGRSSGRQRRQQSGNNSRTLSLDLHFDTADEGTTSQPISVREKTKQIEQFVMTPENNPDPPPKLKFEWGDLIIVGIVESLDVSLEHFASNGFPLRAKVSLSIKEQDPSLMFIPSKRDSSNAQAAGADPAAPGQGTNDTAGNNSDPKKASSALASAAGALLGALSGGEIGGKVGFALEGELGVEFAARMGVSTSAWRGLQSNLSDGLSFSAGEQISFNPSLTTANGVGKSGGVNAGTSVLGKTAQVLSLENTSTSKKSVNNNSDESGKAMASLGGVDASINAIKIAEVDASIQSTILAFGSPSSASTAAKSASLNVNASDSGNAFVSSGLVDGVQGPAIRRVPIIQSGFISPYEQSIRPAQSAPASVDQRAISFGRGVPLQHLFGAIAGDNISKIYGKREAQFSQDMEQVPFTRFSSIPAWQALPLNDQQRQVADNIEQIKNKTTTQGAGCGCNE